MHPTQALEELMRGMDEGETVMIFAGYSSPMKAWMEANAGLYRRISKQAAAESEVQPRNRACLSSLSLLKTRGTRPRFKSTPLCLPGA